MRKRLFVLLGLLMVVGLIVAEKVSAQRLFYNNAAVSVTSSNSALSFTDNGSGGSSVAFLARRVLVRSLAASANTCYFDLKDTVATTSDIPLEPGAWLELEFVDQPGGTSGWSGMGAICDTAQTATFIVTASR